jgi:hypothetical protein
MLLTFDFDVNKTRNLDLFTILKADLHKIRSLHGGRMATRLEMLRNVPEYNSDK